MGRFVSLHHHTPPETDSEEYNVNHRQVRKARGKASAHPCAECSNPALDWAWIHGLDPSSIESYQPMCRLCHQEYDRAEWLKEERRERQERIEKTNAYKGWTEGRRQAQRERMILKWQDEDERKKQSERAKLDQPWKGRRAKNGGGL